MKKLDGAGEWHINIYITSEFCWQTKGNQHKIKITQHPLNIDISKASKLATYKLYMEEEEDDVIGWCWGMTS